jgi:Fur family transcriptional regulator, peroxide stress response regulator
MTTMTAMPSTDQLAQDLRQRGLRVTPQRLAIIGVLYADKSHPSADQVFQRVRANFPAVSLATVYNTLNTLKDSGYLKEISLENAGSRFDTNTAPHAHLICIRCGTIIDPEGSDISDSLERIAQRYRFKPVNQRLDVFGICPDCQAKA